MKEDILTININLELFRGKEKIYSKLIENILNLDRQIKLENKNEPPVVKLARRLEQRSYPKLTLEILEDIITKYKIDNNDLPTKAILINLMIDFLGCIQKSPEYYNYQNNSNVRTKYCQKIGKGFYGRVFEFRPDNIQSKKSNKILAYKEQRDGGIPYEIDKHITSAILLAYYGFQPKYYNKYLMEIGQYFKKSKIRSFYEISNENKRKVNNNNIEWFILYNFVNISDQINNSMQRLWNKDFVKIDIRRLNSESILSNIEIYIEIFNKYQELFRKHKKRVINQLNKLLIIKPNFIIDLIKFRTERGCFEVTNDDLALHMNCLSTSYKVFKITKNYSYFTFKMLKDCKGEFKNFHCEINPALTWMLYRLNQNNVIDDEEYDLYIQLFNKKGEAFEKISEKIKNGEYFKNNNENEIDKKNELNDNKENKIPNQNIEDVNKNQNEINLKEEDCDDKDKNEKEEKIQDINNEIIENKNKDKNNNEDIKQKNENIFKNEKNLKIYDENTQNKNSSISIFNNIENKNKNEDNIITINKIGNINTEKNMEDNDCNKIDSLDFDDIFSQNDNNKNIGKKNNNFIQPIDVGLNYRNQIFEVNKEKKKRKKKSRWSCCGNDALDVID